MATLIPSQLPSLREDGGLFRELDALERLRIGLPDGYEIFHEVTWHAIHEGTYRRGEVEGVECGAGWPFFDTQIYRRLYARGQPHLERWRVDG